MVKGREHRGINRNDNHYHQRSSLVMSFVIDGWDNGGGGNSIVLCSVFTKVIDLSRSNQTLFPVS